MLGVTLRYKADSSHLLSSRRRDLISLGGFAAVTCNNYLHILFINNGYSDPTFNLEVQQMKQRLQLVF